MLRRHHFIQALICGAGCAALLTSAELTIAAPAFNTDSFDFNSLPRATITIDGIGDDWAGITPFIVDPQESTQAGALFPVSQDITAVYVAADDDYIYWRIDVVGNYDLATHDSGPTIDFNNEYGWDGNPTFGNRIESRVWINNPTVGVSGEVFKWSNGIEVEERPQGNGFARNGIAEMRIPRSAFADVTVQSISAYYYAGNNSASDSTDFYPQHSLRLNLTGNGKVSSSYRYSSFSDCAVSCQDALAHSTDVILTAIPDTGKKFLGWSGDCTGTAITCTLDVTRDMTVTANFAAAPILKKLSLNKFGNGTVTSSPAGISCGATCSKEFAIGTAVTLTAKPNTGATFIDWGNCTPVATQPLHCTVKLTTNKNVTANFGTIGMADINISDIKLTPTSPAANSIFSATITVQNQGSATVNVGYLDVWSNQSTEQPCGAFGEEWVDMGSIDAGATKTLTVNLRSNGAGSKKLRAFADSWCQTSESNEDNNQMTKKYTVK
jgi:hypothetical protein